MTAPEKMEAVVAANSVNAAQKMPVALSARFGTHILRTIGLAGYCAGREVRHSGQNR